jgi:Methyltransferase domain
MFQGPNIRPQSIPNFFNEMRIDRFFIKHLMQFKDKEVKFLQIGAFTGDASLWMLENILTHKDSVLIDVDTWGQSVTALGSTEVPASEAWSGTIAEVERKVIRDKYNKKLSTHLESGKVIPKNMFSNDFFATNTETFDFIYIDGNHTYEAVLKDGTNAIEALKEHGIIAFDDYLLFEDRRFQIRAAIDTLDLTGFNILEEYEGDQYWVQKK